MLSSVSNSFTAVHNQTSAFAAQSNKIIAEQQRISQLADDLDENLRFYEYLDPVSRKLNAPGAGRLVPDKEFSEMLANLDGCLKYLDAHVGESRYHNSIDS